MIGLSSYVFFSCLFPFVLIAEILFEELEVIERREMRALVLMSSGKSKIENMTDNNSTENLLKTHHNSRNHNDEIINIRLTKAISQVIEIYTNFQRLAFSSYCLMRGFVKFCYPYLFSLSFSLSPSLSSSFCLSSFPLVTRKYSSFSKSERCFQSRNYLSFLNLWRKTRT